ncbi:proton-conducting transporter membrane subunit [uncultured Desulfovibrio sp.]|uniref:NADH dehydrogenase FAD-containing subunit n=1 Tax=Candidatus Desulfovibrio intestinavium TaxID=2838534 RepID=A0A9D2HN10_9BACT|nr:proton-conducting transporter membrane subunit [uncultured Desulfovibrio sp.]HJA78819.1 NADH dehydrogenase FAD-containing subunit [Candidatus Desulfovibrio intestinavium]
MLEVLFFLPLGTGLLMLGLPSRALRRCLLLLVAVTHLALSLLTLLAVGRGETPAALGGLLAPDAVGALFLGLASTLFAAASWYGVGYLRDEALKGERTGFQDGRPFTNAPERRFTACLCFFLSAMTLVTTTRHLGALWMGIEGTTLASAPLIYFHRHQQSLEATWKYLIICSVGIALALIGNLLLSIGFYRPGLVLEEGLDQVGIFVNMARAVRESGFYGVQSPWLQAAFIFLLVGYGTKMGLAPLHNWLPDAHSQAPSLVSGLLSGALLNCALLGILRGHQIMLAAGLGDFSGGLLVFFGLLSLFTAAIFIVGQGHYKRLLAYSSVEHMGILALGIGLGGSAVFGAMFHAVGHSLTKCMLFLLAGNILTRYHTLSSYDVRGLRWTMPMTGALWTAGFLAIVGSPPFGLFVSEFLILKGILSQGRWLVAACYLLALAVIFVGMSVPVLRMVQGTRPRDMQRAEPESACSVLPPLCLGLLVLCLGLYTPAWLENLLTRAAALIGG